MRAVSPSPPVPLLVGLVRTIRDCCQRKEGEICRKLALTASQFACLLCLPEQGGELNVHAVAETMGLSPSRTSRIVDALVRGGLLVRRAQDSDRRRQLVALTFTGRQKWQLAHQLMVECEEQLLAKLKVTQAQKLAETMQALINAW